MVSRSSGVVSRTFGGEALRHRGVAAHPAEDEHDGRQQRLPLEALDHVDPARDPHPPSVADAAWVLRRAGAALARRAAVPHQPAAGPVVARDPLELAVDRRSLAHEARRGVDVGGREQVVEPFPDHDVLEERHRSLLLDDGVDLAADRLQPLAELLGVGHRRRQRHQRHRLGQVDDDLLPHRAPVAVGEVVDLVHHHEAEAEQRARPGVEHVAQHLGRHHDHRGLAVDGVVAGQQADLVAAVAGDEVGVLLVGERLDRGGVEALAAGRRARGGSRTPPRPSCRSRWARRPGRRAPPRRRGRRGPGSRRAGSRRGRRTRRTRGGQLSGHSGLLGHERHGQGQRADALAVGVRDDPGGGHGHRADPVVLVLRQVDVGAAEQLGVRPDQARAATSAGSRRRRAGRRRAARPR